MKMPHQPLSPIQNTPPTISGPVTVYARDVIRLIDQVPDDLGGSVSGKYIKGNLKDYLYIELLGYPQGAKIPELL